MTASSAFLSAWNAARSPDDSGTTADSWDDYGARMARYHQNASYYDNTIYNDLNTYSAAIKARYKLYKHLRPIYNPVKRDVDSFASAIYGGQLDVETLTTGAIPIVGASPELTEAIKQLWKWSNWQKHKNRYVRQGAKLADSFIKIVTDHERQKVRMEVLHPSKVRHMTVDEVGNIKRIVIVYEKPDNPNNPNSRTYTYTEIIDGEWFRTFKNGSPHAFYRDAGGTPINEWPNEYGFVPVVMASQVDTGRMFGTTSFAESLPQVDEINDAASLLNDNIRKSVNVMWWMAGVSRPRRNITGGANSADTNTIDVSTDERDGVPAIYAPPNTQPFPMVYAVDIASALSNINNMQNELEANLPELLYPKIIMSGNLTAPGVRAAFAPGEARIVEAAANYDAGLIAAHSMACSIGGFHGYAGFEAFDLGSFESGDLQHYIGERSIVRDTLSLSEKLTTLQAAGAPVWLVLRELGYDQETIDRVVMEGESKARNAVRGFAAGIYGDSEDEADDDSATDDESAEDMPDEEIEGEVV